MQTHYQIIFVAPQNNVSQAEVIDNLARLYQTSKAHIQKVLQPPHPVLKRVKTLPEAHKYQQVLGRYGIQCEICTVVAPMPPAPAAEKRKKQVQINPVHTVSNRQTQKDHKFVWLKWLLVLLFVGMAVVFSWQEYQQQRIAHYNDRVVIILENAVAGFEQVLLGLAPYGQGQTVDISTLQHSYEHTIQQLQQALQHIQNLKVPPASSCEDFQRASLAFLHYQMQEGKRIAEILDYIKTHNPGSKHDILVLRKRLHRIGREEAKYQQTLQQAQENMAQTFQVVLKE